MKKSALMVFIPLLISTNLMAKDSEKIFDVSGTASTKYRRTPDRDRVQQNVILKIKASLGNGWEVVGVGVNGPSYSDGWNNLYDSKSDDEFADAKNTVRNFSFRNFYTTKALEFRDTQLKLQAGALNTEKGLASSTALESKGWIDGLRVKAKTEFGEITFSAGTIDQLDETNFYERDIDFNYYEIKMSKEVFEKLKLEVGAEEYSDETFLKATGNYKLDPIANRAIELIGEVIYNTEDDTNKSSVGFKADLMNLVNGSSSNIKLEVRHNHMSEQMGARGSKLTSGFNTSKGDSGSVAFSGPVGESKNFSWFVQYRDNYDRDDIRLEVGVKAKFGQGK